MSSPNTNITSVLKESRKFPPSAEFAAKAFIPSMAEYERLGGLGQRRSRKPSGRKQAKALHWFKKWHKVLEWNEPFAKWFVGGTINASYNCLDRHLDGPRANKAAIIWEGEPGDTRVLRYQDLHREVCKFANVLKKLGIKAGDRVTIYMPMIPEAAIAMLGLRPHRRHAFGRLRRLLGRRRRRSQQRRQIEADHHRRRRLAARQDRAAQAERRRRPGQVADRRKVHRLQSLQHVGRDEAGPRRLVARIDERRLGRLSRPSNSTANIRSSCFTRPVRRASPRASSIRPAAICSARP